MNEFAKWRRRRLYSMSAWKVEGKTLPYIINVSKSILSEYFFLNFFLFSGLLPFGKHIYRLHINNVPTRKLIDKGANEYRKS